MEKKKTILHMSSLGIWDINKGAGRVSTYLPIMGMIKDGFGMSFLSSSNNVQNGMMENMKLTRIHVPFTNCRSFFQFLLYPIMCVFYIYYGIKEAYKLKPSIVYAHCVHTAFPAYIIAKIMHAKYVIRLYGVGRYPREKWRHFPSYLMRKFSLSLKADAYILTNDGTAADLFAKECGAKDERIFFLRNGIKTDVKLCYDYTLRNRITKDSEKLIISLSRLGNGKQVDLIIKAMPGIIKRISAKLLIIGDGDQREYLEKLACELGVEDNVIFLGAKKQSEVYRYLQISDLFISMNSASSMSNPVFESMLCAVPVLALNKGTTKDLITDGVNGYIIEEKDLDNMPLRVEAILRDDMNRTKIGQNARKYILDNFQTWDERVATEIDILNFLIDE